MNISCEVIRDLLPLYHDGVCSNKSSVLVEEHLAECESCKAELAAMDVTLPAQTTKKNLQEAEAVQNLSRRWKRGMWKSALKGVLFTILTIAAIFLMLYLFMDLRYM